MDYDICLEQRRSFAKHRRQVLNVACPRCGACTCSRCEPRAVSQDDDWWWRLRPAECQTCLGNPPARGFPVAGHELQPDIILICACDRCIAAALSDAQAEAPGMCAFSHCPHEAFGGGYFCELCRRQVEGVCVARPCDRKTSRPPRKFEWFCPEHTAVREIDRCCAPDCDEEIGEVEVEVEIGAETIVDDLRFVHFYQLRGTRWRPRTGGPGLNCPTDSPRRDPRDDGIAVGVESRWTRDYCPDHAPLAGPIAVFCAGCQKLRPRNLFPSELSEDEFVGAACRSCDPSLAERGSAPAEIHQTTYPGVWEARAEPAADETGWFPVFAEQEAAERIYDERGRMSLPDGQKLMLASEAARCFGVHRAAVFWVLKEMSERPLRSLSAPAVERTLVVGPLWARRRVIAAAEMAYDTWLHRPTPPDMPPHRRGVAGGSRR